MFVYRVIEECTFRVEHKSSTIFVCIFIVLYLSKVTGEIHDGNMPPLCTRNTQFYLPLRVYANTGSFFPVNGRRASDSKKLQRAPEAFGAPHFEYIIPIMRFRVSFLQPPLPHLHPLTHPYRRSAGNVR